MNISISLPFPRLEGLLKRKNYYESRADLFYYKVVKDWINRYSPGKQIIDVGSHSTPIVLEGEFEHRMMVDLKPFQVDYPQVEQIQTDWMTLDLEAKSDLVLCLQVLEHLDDELVARFAQKVIASGKKAIISVPYRWRKGYCKYHCQDPVTLEKLISWTSQEPVEYYIESRDPDERLIALFEGK
jgi:hypothetical protein